jgi:hypothetical protein
MDNTPILDVSQRPSQILIENSNVEAVDESFEYASVLSFNPNTLLFEENPQNNIQIFMDNTEDQDGFSD